MDAPVGPQNPDTGVWPTASAEIVAVVAPPIAEVQERPANTVPVVDAFTEQPNQDALSALPDQANESNPNTNPIPPQSENAVLSPLATLPMLPTNVEPENGGGSFEGTSMTALMEDANAAQPAAVGATSTPPPPLPGSGGETFTDPLANLPEWMRLIDGVRSMHTNNGGPIRARIMEAVAKAEEQEVKDALEATLSEGTYKSNAAGPTKKAALAVLNRFCPPGAVLPEASAAAARPRMKVATPSAAKSTSASKSNRGMPDFPLGPEGRPSWKDVVDSVKGMATNNGGPIRQRIKEAISAAEGEPEVQEELRKAFGADVYKSNAAGPMKNIALQVLQKFHPGYKASPRVSTRPPETASPATTQQLPAGTPTGVTTGILPQPLGASLALTPMPDPNTLTITFQNMAHPFPCFPHHRLQAVLQFVNDQVTRTGGGQPLPIQAPVLSPPKETVSHKRKAEEAGLEQVGLFDGGQESVVPPTSMATSSSHQEPVAPPCSLANTVDSHLNASEQPDMSILQSMVSEHPTDLVDAVTVTDPNPPSSTSPPAMPVDLEPQSMDQQPSLDGLGECDMPQMSTTAVGDMMTYNC